MVAGGGAPLSHASIWNPPRRIPLTRLHEAEAMRMAPSMGTLQELEHGVGHDYASGSPHIRHYRIRDWIVETLFAVVGDIADRKGSCRVVEIGAGHGTFTDHLLAAGADVVVTEMSEPSAQVLRARFRHNCNVTVVHDPDGQVALRGEPVDAVVCISVLHHIPDYLRTVDELVHRISSGGAFVSYQDPLWYPRRSRPSMIADRGAYFLWRLGQGNLGRGFATRLRRARKLYDESNPADMVEYHVVRKGVDEIALARLLGESFDTVRIERYWSTQSGLFQGAGQKIGLKTTFGLIARGRLQPAAQTE
jgi:phospholipid N-methyltransferase